MVQRSEYQKSSDLWSPAENNPHAPSAIQLLAKVLDIWPGLYRRREPLRAAVSRDGESDHSC